jgi:hypothetical protein
MPNRNPLHLWIVVSIFLAAVTMVPLASRLRSRPIAPPTVTQLRTLTELAEVLTQDAPEWRVVPSAKDGSLERGIYLCTDSRSWKQLSSVTRTCEHANKWQGVVYCEYQGGEISSIPEKDIEMWGEHTKHIEPFLFFGDPELLQRIDKIIANHALGEQQGRP